MSEIMKVFLQLMKEAFYDAEKANRQIFDYKKRGTEQIIALSYLDTAMSKCYAAQALFFSNLDKLEHQELREIFRQFDVFKSEVQNNFATNHSHQWSSIEFERLKDLFEDSVCAQRIAEN